MKSTSNQSKYTTIGQNLPNLMLMAGLQAKEDRKIRSSLSRSWQDLASASKVIMMNIAEKNITIAVAKSLVISFTTTL